MGEDYWRHCLCLHSVQQPFAVGEAVFCSEVELRQKLPPQREGLRWLLL